MGMTTSEEVLSLLNLGEGTAIEEFDAELERVLLDMMDPNKSSDQARSVTLTVKVKPSKSDGMADVTFSCKAGLAGGRERETMISFGKDSRGRPVAREFVQQKLFRDPEKVVEGEFDRREEAGEK